ncbi:hypothetical protein PRIPAC_76360 [Pristionchus pacificus]|uniref:Headcase N-terminal domain-containing protein n=1 Tax=Pristionchus pacificus TaxID=54126 RepID=A0A2A6C5L8_PRIPA|nr:hypothetical protein PRIPAC_76360 [Pristionchus pacificus]|eukprot:PDM73388.1 hypothetical protein PRIPAC_40744 [Pristionchus pacificus]
MGKKDRRAEIPDKKARKNAAAAKEEAKEQKEIPKIKGCHVSIDVCGGCIRPKDPVPEANSQDGVKMSCSNHHCPFSITHSVHKDCFQKLTDKIVGMLLRTGSSSWTDEQRVENAWRKKGLTFVGKFITCPCGHGTQTLEDSENRWSRNGEVVLDPEAYEKHREQKIKKALKHEKPVPTQPKTLNTTFGGKEQAELARKLARKEAEMDSKYSRGDGPAISFPTSSQTAKQKKKETKPSWNPFSSPNQPPATDDDGFTTIGKDGRARDLAAVSSGAPEKKGPQPLCSINVPPPPQRPSPLAAGLPAGNRAERGRTTSCGSGTSWLTSSSNLPPETKKGRGGAGKDERKKGRNKENHANGSSSAMTKKRTFGFAMLSGSEDEQEDEEKEETPNLQSSLRSLRDFTNEFHSYSGIGYWSQSEVKELNEHLALFKSDSALFQCRVTGRKLREPTIITQLTPVTAWIFTTQAMAQKADIPPGTQLSLQEYYTIFHGHEMKHLEDPIIWCRDGTLAALECVDITMLIMGK